jgi:multisubunit Na+/H+ antiporter MnhB subunit
MDQEEVPMRVVWLALALAVGGVLLFVFSTGSIVLKDISQWKSNPCWYFITNPEHCLSGKVLDFFLGLSVLSVGVFIAGLCLLVWAYLKTRNARVDEGEAGEREWSGAEIEEFKRLQKKQRE